MDNQSFDVERIRQKREDREKKKRKKRIAAFCVIAAAVVAVLIASFSGDKVVKDGTMVEIEVEQGASATEIAKALEENGLISSSRKFIRRLKKSEYSKSLKYGVYTIARGTETDEIIKILAGGGALKDAVTVTIPEGFSLEKIVERIAEAGLSTKSELYEAVEAEYDYSFLKEVPNDNGINYKLQGFLFPATYQFTKDMSAVEIIDAMLNEFQKNAEKLNLSDNEIFKLVTVASLVEREAKVDDEREKIAGVIYNRLEKGMRLQIDASVVYAISDGMYNVDRVLYRDLEVASPYNTYVNTGLPIGPICSPGIKSMLAAAAPAKHNYLYYRVDSTKNDGSHIFTENFDEHINAG